MKIFYISNSKIKSLEEQIITCLSSDCKAVNELMRLKQGDIFKINDEYEYLIDKISKFVLSDKNN